MKTLFVFAVLFFSAQITEAQVVRWQTDDSCLTLWQNAFHSTSPNPDSVMVDTCSPYSIWPYYAKKEYLIDLGSDYFHLPIAPIDSVMEVSWRQLDTNYKDLRKRFDSLEQTLGTFRLFKRDPADTTSNLGGEYRIWFDSLLWIHEMTDGHAANGIGVIVSILGVEYTFFNGMPVEESVAMPHPNSRFCIWPNPVVSTLHVHSDVGNIQRVRILDINGNSKRSMTSPLNSFDLDIPLYGLLPGSYFLDVGNEVFHFILDSD